MNFGTDLRVALSFLSRLAPARPEPSTALASSLKAYPAAGLCIGLVSLAPVMLGLFDGRPLLQAALVVALSALVTRGLHWDALSDLADAWGSGTRDERFWEVMKDSRAGAFGVMGCCLAMILQTAALAEVLQGKAIGAALFGFVLGRFLAVALAHLAGRGGPGLMRPGLGKFCLEGAASAPALFALGQTLLAGLLLCSAPLLLWAGALSALGVWMLLRLGRSRGGVNGDFLGSAVIWGETAAWLSWALAG